MSWTEEVSSRLPQAPWGLYLHVPYCATRCGYCDFNTYTAEELGPGVSRATYADSLIAEIRMAREALSGDLPPLATVFVGGGTPTLLGASDLVRVLEAVRQGFGLAPDAEVTTEANPDSVDGAMLGALREGGFTRVSFGVQSLAPHVLAALDRTHTPGRAVAALGEARAAGFEHVSADLIYATPGESDDDLRRSLDEVLDSGIDHLSAYALIVEPGTRLAARIARGETSAPDDDVAAERYVIVDERTSAAGMKWYEVSNWSRAGGECRHNLGYWSGADWWGAGPGAHGHLRGARWWNVKHPTAYAARVSAGDLPVADFEILDEGARRLEHVMLQVRLREGIRLTDVDALAVEQLRDEGLVRIIDEAAVLTLRGRLLADYVVRALTSD